MWNNNMFKSDKSKRVKTPVVFQMEGTECGAASLSIILGYYKKYLPLERLRADCGVSRDGSKAEKILQAARIHGLKADAYEAEADDLRNVSYPFIAFWQGRHFLVVEGIIKDKVYLNDPATGPRKVAFKDFERYFSGVVLIFKKTKKFVKEGKPPRIGWQLMSRLKGQQRSLLFLLLAGVGVTLFNIAFPVFSKIFVDYYVVLNETRIVIPLLYAMLATLVFRFSLGVIQDYYLIKLENTLAVLHSSKMFFHVLKLPIQFFLLRYTGDITYRINSTDRIATVISSIFIQSLLDAAVVMLFFVLLFYFDPLIAVVTLFFSLINILILFYIGRIRQAQSELLANDIGLYNCYVYIGIKIIESLRASGREMDFFNSLSGTLTKVSNSMQSLNARGFLLNQVPFFLNAVIIATVIAIGSYKVLDGQITLGTLIGIQSIIASIMLPLNKLVQVANITQEMHGTISRVDDVLNYKSIPGFLSFDIDKDKANLADGKRLNGHIKVSNLYFGYNKTEQPVLKGINFEIKPGERVAFVGKTGSGKSTLSKLIAGLYEPWQGEIFFDNVPIKSTNRILFSNSVSVVDQNIFIFEGSIKDNITMWDDTIQFPQIIEGAKDACIDDDISAKKGGYDSILPEKGSNLSGGQRQRLEIARALANNPRVLILDESTSAMDPNTEFLIDNNIKKRGCTCIVISHRMSTVRYSDKIFVLDNGEIVESGTHDDLITLRGKYYDLMHSGGE